MTAAQIAAQLASLGYTETNLAYAEALIQQALDAGMTPDSILYQYRLAAANESPLTLDAGNGYLSEALLQKQQADRDLQNYLSGINNVGSVNDVVSAQNQAAQQTPTDYPSTSNTGDSTTSGSIATTGDNLSTLQAWLIARGIVTQQQIADGTFSPADLIAIAKQFGFGSTSGTGGTRAPTAAEINAGLLSNFNPATDFIKIPGTNTGIIRQTGQLVDLSAVEAATADPTKFVPILNQDGTPTGYMVNSKGSVINPGGSPIDAQRFMLEQAQLSETVRANLAREGISTAQLAESIRSNLAAEDIQRQKQVNDAVQNIAALGANPANYVQREYTIRGLESPAFSGTNTYNVSDAFAKLQAEIARQNAVNSGNLAAAQGITSGLTNPLNNALLPKVAAPVIPPKIPAPIVNPPVNPIAPSTLYPYTVTPGSMPASVPLSPTDIPSTAPTDPAALTADLNQVVSAFPYGQQAAVAEYLASQYPGYQVPTNISDNGTYYTPQAASTPLPTAEQLIAQGYTPYTGDYGSESPTQPATVDTTQTTTPDTSTSSSTPTQADYEAALAAAGFTGDFANVFGYARGTNKPGVKISAMYNRGTDPYLTNRGTTTARQFIAGDPSRRGVPNPELVRVIDPPGPNNAEARVTPISQMMMRRMPMYAAGTDPYNIGVTAPTSADSQLSNLYPTSTPSSTGINLASQLSNLYGFSQQPDINIQNLPSIRELMGERFSTLSKEPTFTAAFGAQLPEARAINYGRYLDIRQDPLTYGLLSSLYQSGSRNLDAEAARAKQYSPLARSNRQVIRT